MSVAHNTTTMRVDKDMLKRLKIEAAKRETSIKDLVATCVAVALEEEQEDTQDEVSANFAA